MKKTKSIFCAMLLSTALAGNVFAAGYTGIGVYSLFDNVVNAVVSYFRGNECPPRQCQNCKPGGDNDNGNCRPTEQ